MWPGWDNQVTLNNTTSGGMYIGFVVANQTSSCSTTEHLHQESDNDGVYDSDRDENQWMTGRNSDLHAETLSGINGGGQ